VNALDSTPTALLESRATGDDEAVIVPLTALGTDSSSTTVAPIATIPEASFRVIVDTLRRNDSIYLSLKRRGVPEAQIIELDQAIRLVFRANSESKKGDAYRLELDDLERIRRFDYTPVASPERPVRVVVTDGQLVAQRLSLPLDERVFAIEVSIEDNLANAIAAAGEGDPLTTLLADDIFGSVIDFRTHPRRGDRLGLLFTKRFLNGRFISYGRVLFARYSGKKVSQVAVDYEDPEGARGYYDGDGRSLERMFLINPMRYVRISSGFNRKRFHPVLKKKRPHLGTDYAASTGTRVWATAKGRVAFAERKGGYGKLVEIEHANGYRTRYAHLSRIHVRNGQTVQKAQVVGRVGATGLATGPHLHYELLKDGRHINPASANKGRVGQPLRPKYAMHFSDHSDKLLSMLEAAIGHRHPASGVVAESR
jgi:murein DD-endopeptidase MepM/ murein hydrolase activator NlpD